jgi:lysine 6-dehydrogenase
MTRTFAILGAGMQGTAAAYDLARFANPAKILLADARLEQAATSAARVNGLVGAAICEPCSLNALDPGALHSFLLPVDVVLSCVPFWMHPQIADVAIGSRTHMVDLGGNTEVTWKTLALDERAKDACVTIIPDTGLAPGLVNSIGMFLVDSFDQPESVQLYCGVLPQNPKPPFGYKLTFNIEGLVTEYDHKAVALRDGNIELVDTLAELETVEIDGLGTMEAFTTSGGTSTAPYTLQGRIKNYAYKTLRFPGHCERMRIFKDFGFWSDKEVDIKGAKVRPLDVFCSVFGSALSEIKDTDQCIIRGVGIGEKDGVRNRLQVDLHDKQDSETGFTAMERTTGFSIAIHAAAIANGRLSHGCVRYEDAIPGGEFLQELGKRGIEIKISESPTEG